MKKIFRLKSTCLGILFMLVVCLSACGSGGGNSLLNKMNGKWNGGIVTMEINTKDKTITTFFGSDSKKLSFTVVSESGNSVTIKDNNGKELILSLDNDKLMTTEKSTNKSWPFVRIK